MRRIRHHPRPRAPPPLPWATRHPAWCARLSSRRSRFPPPRPPPSHQPPLRRTPSPTVPHPPLIPRADPDPGLRPLPPAQRPRLSPPLDVPLPIAAHRSSRIPPSSVARGRRLLSHAKRRLLSPSAHPHPYLLRSLPLLPAADQFNAIRKRVLQRQSEAAGRKRTRLLSAFSPSEPRTRSPYRSPNYSRKHHKRSLSHPPSHHDSPRGAIPPAHGTSSSSSNISTDAPGLPLAEACFLVTTRHRSRSPSRSGPLIRCVAALSASSLPSAMSVVCPLHHTVAPRFAHLPHPSSLAHHAASLTGDSAPPPHSSRRLRRHVAPLWRSRSLTLGSRAKRVRRTRTSSLAPLAIRWGR